MTMSAKTLLDISDLVRSELRGHLSDDVCIDRVTSEVLPTSDGEEYVRTTVVLEDGHPELDPYVLNEFSYLIHLICDTRGFNAPSIAYSDKSELP